MKEYFTDDEVTKVGKRVLKDMMFPEEPLVTFLKMSAEKSSYLGKCSKATGKWKFLTDKDFVIEVWGKWWDSATSEQRESLMYHEMLHIDYKEDDSDGEIEWKIKKHDMEEFIDVVKKYGAWNITLEEFKNALHR